MDLRCAVVGHDYGDPERVRERDPQPDAADLIVREYRNCRRCGARDLVRERTRVRTRADGGEDAAGTDEDEDVEVLTGDIPPGDEPSPSEADRERMDDIIEAPSEDPPAEVPEDVDLSTFETGTTDPETADPTGIIEADEETPTPESTSGDSEPASPAEEGSGTTYVCPACGLSKRASATSLHPGDICPRCREDYLEERPG